MSTSTHQHMGEASEAVTDADIAAETNKIHTAEGLNTPETPQADAAPDPKLDPVPEPPKAAPEAPKSMADIRRERMDAMSRAHHQTEMSSQEQARGKNATPEPENVETTSPDEVESEQDQNVNLPENVRRSADGQFVVVQKINGKEKEVPLSRALADAQKAAAADEKFRETAELRKELEQLKAQIAQGQQPSQPSSDVAVSAPPARADGQQAVSRETLNKAFIEDDPEATQAIVERLNRENMDPGQIISQATQSAVLEIQREAALQSVSTDPSYGEINQRILADNHASTVANEYSRQLLESEPNLSVQQNIAKALEMTREWLGQYAPPAPAQTSDSLQARAARKAAHVQANAPVGTSARQPAQGPTMTTPKQARDQLRAARIAGG